MATVEFSYVNNSPLNVDQVDIYDFSNFGVKPRADKVVDVKVRNIRGYLSE